MSVWWGERATNIANQFWAVCPRDPLQKLNNISILHPWRNQTDPGTIVVEMKYTVKRQNARMRKLPPCHSFGGKLLKVLYQKRDVHRLAENSTFKSFSTSEFT